MGIYLIGGVWRPIYLIGGVWRAHSSTPISTYHIHTP